ncbi:uncharacterized protein Triagg1_6877 [Trichoderma aggressivum f. europaeum]|uniref:Uncharacterized protein n=1 Tax=Trichoderma aggressivum f. europaeum TaxID=173218 RepID=A0AAE1LZ52_9HYPO|nr:hypothetical protein Triagg1_6877 [Trichoderma aggressivum f. europaeum]
MSSTGGSQRANEVNSAMLNIPGYADDTMLFMMRWGSLAQKNKEADVVLESLRHSPGNQATLRKVDYDEFLVRLSALNKHWFASQRTGGSPVSVVGTRGSGQGDDGGPKAAAAAAAAAEAASCEDDRDGGGVHTGDDDDAVDPLLQAAELKARTLELVEDFPQLVRDFDKFVDCTRVMAAKYGRAPA